MSTKPTISQSCNTQRCGEKDVEVFLLTNNTSNGGYAILSGQSGERGAVQCYCRCMRSDEGGSLDGTYWSGFFIGGKKYDASTNREFGLIYQTATAWITDGNIEYERVSVPSGTTLGECARNSLLIGTSGVSGGYYYIIGEEFYSSGEFQSSVQGCINAFKNGVLGSGSGERRFCLNKQPK